MRIEPRRARRTSTTLAAALTAIVTIGSAGCDGSAPPGGTATTSAETPPAPAIDISIDPPGATPPAQTVSFPDNAFYPQLSEGFRELEDEPAPKFSFSRWAGGTEPQVKELERLIGPDGRFTPCLNEKLVIVHYWTTAAPAGLRTIDRNNELLQRFADEDVVFVAIHPNVQEWGVGNVGPALDTHGAKYPSAIDAEDRATEMDWNFDIVPGYVLIDQQGIVRAAGLRATVVPECVDALLEEWDARQAAAGRS